MAKSYRPGGIGMIPAEPGTYLAHLYFDDNDVDLVRANVVGWQISSNRVLTPLVVDPGAVAEGDFTVIHPDGRVESSDGQVWDSIDSWIGERRREYRIAA